jgi:hypothetical protein
VALDGGLQLFEVDGLGDEITAADGEGVLAN